jgi:hypothetical protein
MGDGEKRVVWVLGAGFSAALGGPMLRDLLGPGSEQNLHARFRREHFELLWDEAANAVRTLYLGGRDEGLWGDAEAFLDYLDTAAEDREPGTPNPHHERVTYVIGEMAEVAKIKRARAAARRLVAAECSAFLEAVDTDREQWQPFKTWSRSLTANDTVITFNYDRLVEMVSDAHDKEARRNNTPMSRLSVLMPGHLDDPNTWRGCTPVLKLHGSVDWKKQFVGQGGPRQIVVRKAEPLFALSGPELELAIATPGPSKKREADGFGELWRLARKALGEADTIVFVGYRFPETDADAREQLLRAIGDNGSPDNKTRPKHLSLHIVLGRDRDAAERLASLLRFVCKKDRDELPLDTTRAHAGDYRFRVTTHPLFAQDFFTVARRDDL